MKRLSIFFLGLLAACNPASTETPEGVLSDTLMRDLMIEFYMADAASMINQTENQFAQFRPELFYESALKQKGIDRETFIKSLEFYQQEPKKLEKIYESAISELAQRQIGTNP
jgi:DNA integrity scanning protein DisA with diadenylate cyclase activity